METTVQRRKFQFLRFSAVRQLLFSLPPLGRETASAAAEPFKDLGTLAGMRNIGAGWEACQEVSAEILTSCKSEACRGRSAQRNVRRLRRRGQLLERPRDRLRIRAVLLLENPPRAALHGGAGLDPNLALDQHRPRM